MVSAEENPLYMQEALRSNNIDHAHLLLQYASGLKDEDGGRDQPPEEIFPLTIFSNNPAVDPKSFLDLKGDETAINFNAKSTMFTKSALFTALVRHTADLATVLEEHVVSDNKERVRGVMSQYGIRVLGRTGIINEQAEGGILQIRRQDVDTFHRAYQVELTRRDILKERAKQTY